MSHIIRTLVVDDEPLAQELVTGYVEQVPFLSLVGCCSSAADALSVINNGGVDLVLLDIQMPGMSGLSLAKSLTASGAPKVIFTTAYGEYAIDGFKLDAVDYLLKPFDLDEFLRAVGKARHLIELERRPPVCTPADTDAAKAEADAQMPPDDFFFVKSEYKLVKIIIEKILYVEGLKDYVKIFTSDSQKPIVTLATLKQMENRLLPHSFVRIHRSYIANVKLISGVERNAVLVGNERLPIGDGYRQNLQSILDKLTI